MAFLRNFTPFAYLVIYLVKWRKAALKCHFHFAVYKKMFKTELFGTKYTFFSKRSSLRSQIILSFGTLGFTYFKLVGTPCRVKTYLASKVHRKLSFQSGGHQALKDQSYRQKKLFCHLFFSRLDAAPQEIGWKSFSCNMRKLTYVKILSILGDGKHISYVQDVHHSILSFKRTLGIPFWVGFYTMF